MPLPKLPTRPAAILEVTDLKLEPKDYSAPQLELSSQPSAPIVATTQLASNEKPSKSIVIDLSGLSVTSDSTEVTEATNSTKTAQSSTKRPIHSERPLRPKPPKVSAANSAASKKASHGLRKLFVLDTNVLLHDPSSLFRFEEHDVFLPMMTLEELDHQKKGMSEVARNARQVSRSLDTLVGEHRDLDLGLCL